MILNKGAIVILPPGVVALALLQLPPFDSTDALFFFSAIIPMANYNVSQSNSLQTPPRGIANTTLRSVLHFPNFFLIPLRVQLLLIVP